ncbi:MAG: DNA polymerase III subunit beta [Kofleriaceae bacterium]|jgi:DNA polymerase-3 subunit beta|nr:DNA polymerase III subunit beta [Kofleriaceae bacterium]MBP6837779.1 DNA polymerase III subunit beta [Kofleriaceae bacterium]MBP9203671.1 DNA polymerase III subunit beta [Kofleriaceae bacterium]
MEFRIAKTEFLRGLRLAQNIADRKSTMPLLANVLLRTIGKNKLLVAATDLNVSLVAELKSTNTTEGGLTVSAKNLHELVSSAPGDDIVVKKGDNNWAELKSGKVSYRIVGMSDRDFPKVPDAKEAAAVEVESGALREMIDRTLFSVCNDETRFHLNGVLFESDGANARMVSTDGHRLSKVARELAGPKLSAGVIIPKKGILELKRLLESGSTCKLAVKTPYLFAVCDDLTLAIKLIESQFPPYEQVIPKDLKKQVVVDRVRLIESLRRAQLMSSETRGVKFALGDANLTITSDNPDLGEVREELDVDYSGGAIAIGFNPKYVIELLSQMSADQIALHLGGELDPGVFKPMSGDDYLGVVMPMRI